MRVFPHAQVMPIAACEYGQLVREVGYGAQARFSIVAQHTGNDEPCLVHLDPDGPTFERVDVEDTLVLAYQDEVIWEIDQSKLVETEMETLFEKIGCIITAPDGTFVTVRPNFPTSPPRKLQLCLEDGALRQFREERARSMYFGCWRAMLYPPSSHDCPAVHLRDFACE